MPSLVKMLSRTCSGIPTQYRPYVAILVVAMIAAGFWRPFEPDTYISSKEPAVTSVPQTAQTPTADGDTYFEDIPADEVPSDDIDANINNSPDEHTYTISRGDTLMKVLNQYDISTKDVLLLVQQNPAVANVNEGQSISWRVDDEGQLLSLTWKKSNKEEVVYTRNDAGVFTSEVNMRSGQLQQQHISGVINSSFMNSAYAVGLTNNEISSIIKALQWQVDFKKLRNNDRFSVVLSREMLDGKVSSSSVVAVRLFTQAQDHYAILADDGHYYDRQGNSLGRGFLRLPMLKAARVSSPFNPRRLHPITHRIAPHNGVDFAIPVGTPVLATGDGVVMIAKRSGAAGNYIAIRHGRQYATRYMHLSKILVKPGEHVKRGQRIGLSGNTGRSTGPHLHYEFHINGKPVDPLKVSLPKAEGLTGKHLQEFLVKVRKVENQLAF